MIHLLVIGSSIDSYKNFWKLKLLLDTLPRKFENEEYILSSSESDQQRERRPVRHFASQYRIRRHCLSFTVLKLLMCGNVHNALVLLIALRRFGLLQSVHYWYDCYRYVWRSHAIQCWGLDAGSVWVQWGKRQWLQCELLLLYSVLLK